MTGIALIYQVFTVVFISVGTFTNATSAYVYSRKLMRKTSYSTYLFSLAFVDMLVTLTGNIRLGLMFYNTGDLVDDAVNSNYPGFDIRELSIVSCRLHIFFTYYFLQLSSTIICLLNLDRVFGVLSSLRARKFCKPSIARRLVISAMLVLALVNVHLLIFMGDFDGQIEFIEMSSNNSELFYDDKEIKCRDLKHSIYHNFWNFYFFIDTSLYCIMPFIIMITCNSLIIGKIVKSRFRSKQVIVRRCKTSLKTKILENKSNAMLGTEKRLSFTLISISFSFLIFTMPVFFIENMENYQIVNTQEDFWAAMKALAYMLMYMNHVINFFFYCLLGPKFRNEIKKLVIFKWMFKKEQDSVYPLRYSRRGTTFQDSESESKIKRSIKKMDVLPMIPASVSLRNSNEILNSLTRQSFSKL